ncbi:hypothetical protein TNCV_3533081 [Trichonephila clavipes]|nr:hypothetical protein TNCV_3533081 [Trichonephila clavipes]
MLEKVIENWTSRLDYIRASRGSPMPEIIFQMDVLRHGSTGPGASASTRLGEGVSIRPRLVTICRDVLRHGSTGPGSMALTTMRPTPRSRLSLNEILVRVLSTAKYFFRFFSPKNWEFRTGMSTGYIS